MKSIDEYRTILHTQERNLNLVLDEVVNSFPLYKIDNSFKDEYLSDIANLEKIKSEIFLNMNSLRKDSKFLSDSLIEKNIQIAILNKENKKLERVLNSLENENGAASRELLNRKERYYIKLIENIILLSVAVLLAIILGKQIKQ